MSLWKFAASPLFGISPPFSHLKTLCAAGLYCFWISLLWFYLALAQLFKYYLILVFPLWIFCFSSIFTTSFSFAKTHFLINFSITLLSNNAPFFMSSTLAKSLLFSSIRFWSLSAPLDFFLFSLFPLFFSVKPNPQKTLFDPTYDNFFTSVRFISFATKLSFSIFTRLTSYSPTSILELQYFLVKDHHHPLEHLQLIINSYRLHIFVLKCHQPLN